MFTGDEPMAQRCGTSSALNNVHFDKLLGLVVIPSARTIREPPVVLGPRRDSVAVLSSRLLEGSAGG